MAKNKRKPRIYLKSKKSSKKSHKMMKNNLEVLKSLNGK